MEYRIDDRQLDAAAFIEFVNQVWPGEYDEDRTAGALARTLNITAYDGESVSETGHRQQAASAGQRKHSCDIVFRGAA